MGDAFRKALLEARDETHSRAHPFIDKWASGELTRPQTAVYVTQHYHYVSEFLSWIAYVASQTPEREVRRHLLMNLAEEEDPQDTHMDMLFDYAEACGVSRDAVLKAKILPWTEALRDWGWRTAYREPWQVALAGFLVGLESQPPDIYSRIVPALAKHYGWPEGTRAVRFFRTHIEADTVHGARGLDILASYCDHPALQEQAIQCVGVAARKRWEHMNGIYWYALHGREDTTPPFP
jgi:pyrroloquinoline-quinone synthase